MDGHTRSAAEDTLNVTVNQWIKTIGIDDAIEILDQMVERLEMRREEATVTQAATMEKK